MPTSPIWHVPYQRNPFFTGREETLHQLHSALYAENTVALSHPQGISGLGGIGKTQTALEFAYRYCSDYDAVFWVHADSVVALASSLTSIARVLELPERNKQDQELIIQAVLRWFHLHPGWLLIYDNIEDFSLVKPFLPASGAGHLLFTTRSHALEGVAQRLQITKLEPEVGALLLLRRAQMLAFQATLDTALPEDRNVAQTISEELDGLPLALDQAGAYIKEAPCRLSEYLTSYRTRRGDLLQERGRFDQSYPASVATTWSLSFTRVRQQNPVAAELLRCCAFLHPEAIPEELFSTSSAHLSRELRLVEDDPLVFDKAIQVLLSYSLVQRDGNSSTLSIHRLVQAVLTDTLAHRVRKRWHVRIIRKLSTLFPERATDKLEEGDRLFLHARACIPWIEQEAMPLRASARLLNLASEYLRVRGQYGQAEPLMKDLLAIYRRAAGAWHPYTATGLNNLALLYQSWGRYEEADPLYRHALVLLGQAKVLREIAPDTSGPDNLAARKTTWSIRWRVGCQAARDVVQKMLVAVSSLTAPFAMRWTTGASFNNLAMFYQIRGRYAEAEPLYLHALAVLQPLLGPTHPDLIQTLGNLAMLYRDQGKYEQAEPLYLRALSICEQQLGDMHIFLAQSLNNLALLYQDQGRYEEAEPLFRRALNINEQKLGADHPSTATSLSNLALLSRDQGNYADAEPLLQRAFTVFEEQLGAAHPDTANILNNLALIYEEQGRSAEAEPLYLRALAIREEHLGANHPDTAMSLCNLATLYRQQGKYAEAEPLHRRALAIREEQLGISHPITSISLNNLGLLYSEQGKYEQAEPLYLRALAIREQRWGDNHPDTVISLKNLAALYRDQEMYKQAEPLYRRILTISEQRQGTDHPDTAFRLLKLAELYQELEKYAEAESLYRRALAIFEQHAEAQHIQTARSLALLYVMQKKYEEAERLCLRILAMNEQRLEEGDPDTIALREMLIDVFTVQGKHAEAELLSQRVQHSQGERSGQKHPQTDRERFDRFTENALRVLSYAHEEARNFQQTYLGTEHLLLGLVRNGQGTAIRVLHKLGVEPHAIRATVEALVFPEHDLLLPKIALSPQVKKAIELAVDEAISMQHNYIGTEHLLLGLVREDEGIAAGALKSLGVTLEEAHEYTLQALDEAK